LVIESLIDGKAKTLKTSKPTSTLIIRAKPSKPQNLMRDSSSLSPNQVALHALQIPLKPREREQTGEFR
jgi:hypothetical protein